MIFVSKFGICIPEANPPPKIHIGLPFTRRLFFHVFYIFNIFNFSNHGNSIGLPKGIFLFSFMRNFIHKFTYFLQIKWK